MAAEVGHEANRSYRDQSGNFHLNGGALYNDAEVDAIVECILNAARKQAHEEIEERVQPDAQVHP